MSLASYIPEPSKFITPIACSSCDGNAHLIRRTPKGPGFAELRTFECDKCGVQIELESG